METPRVRRELSYENKMEVVTRLQQLTIMGKLVRGAISTTAKHMQLHRTTVSNVWEGFKRNSRMPSGKLGRVGGKTINTSSIVTTLVSEVPEEQRSTMRDISQATGLSMGTLSRRLKDGTIERKNTRLKPLLTRILYRDYVITRVVPAIKAKFPSVNKRVVLQHDNATPHGAITDAILACVSTDGWTFVVQRQPPNSPDLNVLDLGYFASIQSLQNKVVSHSIDDVIQSTLAFFEALSSEKLENVFHTFQAVMRLVLEHNGSNHFPLSHLKKDAKRRAGTLSANLSCPASLLG
ncbi:hypothetical protein DYB30_006817 [Aphanomyces astaci]|uniref:Transposase Tc1-like domain-containing protein n=1 Tax=Aphanomyces astaci TaxID=112090 RepID=A0A397CEL6_APHAT|nr:hypothetical protein DYB30_006817 [Aphanomyces astaci]